MMGLKGRAFACMVMVFGLLTISHAETAKIRLEPREPIKSQHLLMAIVYADPALLRQLHRGVSLYSPEHESKFFLNVNKILRAIPPVAKVCNESLAHLRKLHEEDLANESHWYLPVADIYYLEISELVTHLENTEDPAFDRAAYDDMRKTYEELFDSDMPKILDHNSCWAQMSRQFIGGTQAPLVQQGCNAFDELRQCIEEMRRIDALSEIGYQRVRDGYYDGRIPQRINPWRKK